MKITIMGPPGGGKGPQAEIISKKLSVPHISTGAIIRNAIRNQTELGKAAKQYIDDGQLVPDDVVIGMVSHRLAEDDCKNGYILDGFPRTLVQAQSMDGIGIKLDCVLNLLATDEQIIDRLSGRRECKQCAAPYHIKYNPPKVEGKCDKCGGELIMRSDDNPDTIRERLAVYHKQTEPLIGFYRNLNLLKDIPGRDTIEETTAEVYKALGVDGQ